MDLTIYPLGDSAFIERVLNAVAIYTGQDSFAVTVATAALLGVFATAIQSIMKNGREIDIASIFVGIGAYILLFGSLTVTVNMEDRTTGAYRTVDHVPAGVAIPTYLISNIGFNISEGFETVYSSVSTTNQNSMTAGGTYADSLQALVDLRERAYSEKLFDEANQKLGGQSDFRKSLYNYIKECTMPKYELGFAPQSDLSMLAIKDAIQFQSEIYYTEYYGPTGPQDLTCNSAWTELSDTFDTIFTADGVKDTLNKALRGQSNLTWEDKLQNSSSEVLAGLGGGGLSAQDMALTTLVEPIMLEAAQGLYDSWQDENLAIAMTNAIEKRNIAWAAQRSFFQETMYPMLTFFEGMSFAITPFIAFLMVMGAFGIKLGLKYFMLVIWIQLWLPLLSIVDMFITEGASNELLMAGSASGASVNSIYFMNAAYDTAKTWIGTGSYMATSVPMIALFLVSGSMYGAASLANSISASTAKGAEQAADSVQPDAFNMGSLMQISPGGSANALTGTTRTGAEGMAGSFNLSGGAAASVQSAQQELSASNSRFNESFGTALTNSSSSGEASKLLETYGQSTTGASGTVATAVSEQAKSLDKQFNLTDTQADAIKGALAAGASGGVSSPKGLLAQAGINGQMTAENSDSTTLAAAFAEAFGNVSGSRFSETERADYSQQVNSGFSEAVEKNYSEGATSAQTKQLTNASEEVQSSQESLTQAQTLQSALGSSGSVDNRYLASLMSDADKKALSQGLAAAGVDASGYQETLANLDMEHSDTVGMLMAASASGNADAIAAATAASASALGLPMGVGDISAPSGNAAGGVDAAIAGAQLDAVKSGMTFSGGISPEDFFKGARNEVDAQSGAWMAAMASDQGQLALDGMQERANHLSELPTALDMFGADVRAGTNAMAAGDSAVEAASSWWDGVKGTFGDQIDNVSNRWDASEGLGEFFTSMSNNYGSDAGAIMQGVGDAFSGGLEAGIETFNASRGEMVSAIAQEAMSTAGLNSLQANLLAESQVAMFGQHFAGDSFDTARQNLIDAYTPEIGAQNANNMADLLVNGGGNVGFSGASVNTVTAFNEAGGISMEELMDNIEYAMDQREGR
ncbi:conjugal transfer protein TraG N-terminal domain-containing protein [Marinobacter sp. F3R08]|uniref:conjugal transfer protein TraG N-terminal domain-containing protein n=1 Tax=Marinobacter sp. F3R08 TaxID=2841559 RepID=UPI001C08AE6E|nr:conjugal transfer protein TraG N-terminal domain-containing protein [Marinobacter sp. F3R08]MBU2952323.1 conjugal transfer protein TraG N-terminal domain-containing protein [Marinobacter sp. F3R08]